jgi:F0F1-type ATP synthase assembly protein I
MIPTVLAVIAVVLLLGTTMLQRRAGGIRFAGLAETSPLVMRIVVSLVVLAAGLYVILDHAYQVEDKKWGYGIVGTVVGYWLKG